MLQLAMSLKPLPSFQVAHRPLLPPVPVHPPLATFDVAKGQFTPNLRYHGTRPRLPFLFFAWHARNVYPYVVSSRLQHDDPNVGPPAGAQHSSHRYKTITLFPHVTRQRPCAFCLLIRREKRHMMLLERVASCPAPSASLLTPCLMFPSCIRGHRFHLSPASPA